MTRSSVLLAIIALPFCCVRAEASAPLAPPEVDVAAVLRMGDTVQHVGGLIEAEDESTADFVAAMAVPPDDSDKWFVSVICTAKCAPCERLKEAWKTDKHLLALGDPNHPKESWSHLNFFVHGDASQDWRWKEIKITAYPTILVQPPARGRGNPATVVYQGVYGGDPEALLRDVSRAVKRYLEKLSKQSRAEQPEAASPRDGFGQGPFRPDWSIDPPWNPRPKNPPAVTPSPVTPAPSPADDLDGLQVPPPDVLAPAPTPAPTPSPSGTSPEGATNPNDLTPEAVIVTETGDVVLGDRRFARLVQKLGQKVGTGNLSTRLMNWADARDRGYPVRRDELPAVLMTQNGRIVDKLSSRLLDLIHLDDPTLSDIPWSSIIALVTTGFSIPAAAMLASWLLAWYRRKRAETGKSPMLPADLQKLVDSILSRRRPCAISSSTPADLQKLVDSILALAAKSRAAQAAPATPPTSTPPAAS